MTERELVLRQKAKRLDSALHDVKLQKVVVKRTLDIAGNQKTKAKKFAKDWEDKESDKINKDKDSLLKKYLKSRDENQKQLKDAVRTVNRQKKSMPSEEKEENVPDFPVLDRIREIR